MRSRKRGRQEMRTSGLAWVNNQWRYTYGQKTTKAGKVQVIIRSAGRYLKKTIMPAQIRRDVGLDIRPEK